MLTEEKISIIIPVYNNEKYIEECINSVINQTYQNWELILIDDGSNDSSLSLCEKYKNDIRVKIIQQKNSGVSVARNNGIKEATGKYITFIDSDDFVENDYCSLLISFMRDDVSMVVLGLKKLKLDGTEMILPHRLESRYYSFFELEGKIIDDGTASGFTLHSPCSILYRKEVIEKNSLIFNSNIKYNEDGLFNTLYFVSAKKSVYINYNIAPYTYRENCYSATHTIDLLSNIYENNRMLVEENLSKIGGIYLSYENLSVQLERRKVTLFLEEAIYALRIKRVNYNFFKKLMGKYNIKKNLSILCFSNMTRKKRIFFSLLRIKLYFLVYCLLKNTK